MGWSSEIYRYKQYKNALDYINRHRQDEALDFSTPIEPRKDYNLQTTLIEGLKELLKFYEAVALLEPESEDDDQWFECSECGARLSPLYWEDAPEEWYYCPSCGCRFEGEHILEEMGVHTRKCENCGHLRVEGYEYPESYCELGIPEDDPRYDGEGCSYTAAQREEICRKQKENGVSLWWDENKNKEEL